MSLEAGFTPEEYSNKESDFEPTENGLEHPDLDQATAWSLEVLSDNRPNEEDFVKNWSPKERAKFLFKRDKFFSRKSRKGGVGLFENEGQQYGLILEGLFADPKFSEVAFGMQIVFRPATRWDDSRQGIDSLLTIKGLEGKKNMLVALDFTIGESRNYLVEKFKKSIELTKKSQLVNPMYQDPFTHKIGYPKVPKLIVIADREDIDECITPWLNEDYKSLAKTKLAELVISELYYEMHYLSKYLESSNLEDLNHGLGRYMYFCKTRLAEIAKARGIDYLMEGSDREALNVIKRTLEARLETPKDNRIGSFRIVN